MAASISAGVGVVVGDTPGSGRCRDRPAERVGGALASPLVFIGQFHRPLPAGQIVCFSGSGEIVRDGLGRKRGPAYGVGTRFVRRGLPGVGVHRVRVSGAMRPVGISGAGRYGFTGTGGRKPWPVDVPAFGAALYYGGLVVAGAPGVELLPVGVFAVALMTPSRHRRRGWHSPGGALSLTWDSLARRMPWSFGFGLVTDCAGSGC